MSGDVPFYNVISELQGKPFQEIRAIQKNLALPYSVAAFNLDGSLNWLY